MCRYEIGTSSLVEEDIDAAVVSIVRRLPDNRLIIGVKPFVGHWVTSVRRVVTAVCT